MRKNIRKMYTYVAKNLITVAICKCVLKSLRLSQRVLNWIHNCYEVARAHAVYGLSCK